MKYTVKDLRADFPDDDACLQWLVEYLYPDGITCVRCETTTKHYKLTGRKVYSCGQCGHQVSPTAGTIFHKSRTSLTDWFYVIYLMSTNKAGTPATQIVRELGVTYKTALRMLHKIRTMMEAPDGLLNGDIEIDETYVHANTFKRSSARKRYGYDARRSGQVIFGILQRGGPIRMWHIESASTRRVIPLIQDNVKYGSLIHTDGWLAYKKLPQRGYAHKVTDHGKQEWVSTIDPTNYTQTIEAVWSTMKPRIKGTYRHITPKYLQNYANEYAWRYSNRNRANMFWALMCRVHSKK